MANEMDLHIVRRFQAQRPDEAAPMVVTYEYSFWRGVPRSAEANVTFPLGRPRSVEDMTFLVKDAVRADALVKFGVTVKLDKMSVGSL